MLKTVFLTDVFYRRYQNCPEIEQKFTRPYIRVEVVLDGILWAIPLRSSIKHKYAIWTDKDNGCGIDLTKAVVVEHPAEYISDIQPRIRENEFRVIKQLDNHFVASKLKKYILDYKKAKTHPEIKRNENLLRCSTLQYFEDYI